MPRMKKAAMPQSVKSTTKANPLDPEQQKEDKYTGPYYRVEADAAFSRNYTGKVDFGTFTESEHKKGVVGRRVAQLEREGHKNINIIFISGGEK